MPSLWPSGSWRSPRLWLPQPKCCTGRVDDDRERARVRHLGDVAHHSRAERFRLGGRRLDVVDQRIGQPGRWRARYGVLHHAPAGALTHIDHRVVHAATHIHVLQLPIEQRGVKGLGLVEVGAGEFDMHERIGHDCSPIFGAAARTRLRSNREPGSRTTHGWRAGSAAAALLFGLVLAAGPARGAALALVLAIDVSASVTADSYLLQHDGIARAFIGRRLVEPILAMPGGVEVLVLEWSDPD